MIKLIKYIKFLFISKKSFFPPEKKEILIFDETGSNNFLKYIKKKNYSILNTRFEKINLFVLCKTLLNRKLNFLEYINNYIKIVKPKIVLTFIDNNPLFYKIDHKNFNKSIFVQNGIRSSFNDIFHNKNQQKINENFVDYMFVANEFYGKKFSSFIRGKTIPIGYFKNNLYKISNVKKKREILIISVFRNYNNNDKIYKNISYKNFFSNDKYFYSWLDKYCKKKKLKINILTRARKYDEFLIEKKYFENFFSNANIIFVKSNPYKIIDAYEYVVTNDSTLGIENLSRGGKTAFICNAPNIYPLITRKFGFNENLSSNGPFWTWENKVKKFEKILNFLIKHKKEKWKKYTKNILIRDNNNKTFNKYLNKTLRN